MIATRVYSNMIANFSFVYASAISTATQIIVGHLVGAGDIDDADELVMKTLKPTVLVSLIMSVIVFLCSDFIFSWFTNDPVMIALG